MFKKNIAILAILMTGAVFVITPVYAQDGGHCPDGFGLIPDFIIGAVPGKFPDINGNGFFCGLPLPSGKFNVFIDDIIKP